MLKAAVTGELTRAWREQNADKLESGEALLKRILKARREAWEQAELEKLCAKGKRPKDDAWKSRYVEPQGPDAEGLPELPQGWAWVNLEILKVHSLYGPRYSSDAYSDSGYYVVRTSDINDSGKINILTAPTIDISRDDYIAYKLEPGDIVFTRTGSLGTLAVYNDRVEAIPGAYLIQYRLIETAILPQFVYFTFRSPDGNRYLVSGGKGVGRPNLNAPTIEAYPIALPPVEEQKLILDTLCTIQTNIDAMESSLNSALQQARALRQSILKAAFSGTLVPQDPNDEPAGEILKRIAAERVAQGTRPARSAAPRAPRKARAAAPPSASAPAAPPAAVSILAAARKAAGLSQAQLAAATGINQAYVSQMETGKRAMTADQAAAIAKALGVEPSVLTQA